MDANDRKNQFNELAPSVMTDEFKMWLENMGYFDCPASTKFHGSYDGGLYYHSFGMYEKLSEFTEKGLVKWEREESPFIIGMLHDVCKLDMYIKNENTEKWEYDKYNQNCRYHTGHADKSLLMLMGRIQLTEQEMRCIRWHMGAFDEKENWSMYSKSVEMDEAVLYTHTADMYTSNVRGI